MCPTVGKLDFWSFLQGEKKKFALSIVDGILGETLSLENLHLIEKVLTVVVLSEGIQTINVVFMALLKSLRSLLCLTTADEVKEQMQEFF